MRTGILLLALVATAAGAQGFPSRPLRIVTSEAGGLNDLVARVVAQAIGPALHKPVIVENRGVVAIEVVARATPDGHTALCFANNFWLLPYLQSKVAFDPLRDFAPLTLAVTAPNVLAVHASVPAGSVKELIALAKSRPRALNYGSGVAGGTPHLAAELFRTLAGIEIVRVGYKGTAPAVTALAAGETQMMFAGPGSIDPHARSGRVRALAVTSRAPSALAPGLPTLSEAGVPGYEATAMIALFAPAKTPPGVVARLSDEMVNGLGTAEVKERLLAAGAEVAATSREELARVMRSEMTKWQKVIREARIAE